MLSVSCRLRSKVARTARNAIASVGKKNNYDSNHVYRRCRTSASIENSTPLNFSDTQTSFKASIENPTPLNFSDAQTSFKSKSMPSLVLSYLIFAGCTFAPLVQNADRLLALSYRLLGQTATDAVVKATFFKQFCGGETAEDLRPTIDLLKQFGINGILDYAAENAPDEQPPADGDGAAPSSTRTRRNASTFLYKNEEKCEHHVGVFKTCIEAVRTVTPTGFGALKVTALGDPLLLKRMSRCIDECYRLMRKFDTDGDGTVNVADFEENYRRVFVDADARLPGLIARLDPTGSGRIDYVVWSKMVQPADVPRLASAYREEGPLSLAAPTEEDLAALESTKRRLDEVAQAAFDNKVRLLIDAEQTWFQPAIDNFALELMRKYNDKSRTDTPVIFNTYQCYLKSTPKRLRRDLELGRRGDFHFGAKLVRGAYMVAERAQARDRGAASPIHDTLQDTHDCYDAMVQFLFDARLDSGGAGGHGHEACEVMLGSHNQESVERAVAYVEGRRRAGAGDLRPAAHFAQLLGMRDNLTFALGEAGYNAYKYVPYGRVGEVLPYLVRRAQENGDVTTAMDAELGMIKGEIRRRVLG